MSVQKKIDLNAEMDFLEEQISQISRMLEELIENEGEPIRLNYASREKIYLCLVANRDKSSGRCVSVRWDRFKYSGTKQIWLDGWSPHKIPNSTVKRMGSMDRVQFKDTNEKAKKILTIRGNLLDKKKRVLATFNSVHRYDSPKLKSLDESIGGL